MNEPSRDLAPKRASCTTNALRTRRQSSNYFSDDGGDPHEANINGIASEGIAVGDGVHTYRPTLDINRGQMAAFIVRHLAVLEEAGIITPVP